MLALVFFHIQFSLSSVFDELLKGIPNSIFCLLNKLMGRPRHSANVDQGSTDKVLKLLTLLSSYVYVETRL